MSDSLGRRSLARVAARLARTNTLVLPVLALFTDEDRLPDPVAAARRLPLGSLVIARARKTAARKALVEALLPVVRTRGHLLLVADDPVLAASADGLHLPDAGAHKASIWRSRYPHWLITASAHSPRTFLRSEADAFFVAPVFPTASHVGRAGLTPVRAASIAKLSVKPVYALGGITPRNAVLLDGLGFSGLAAISALT